MHPDSTSTYGTVTRFLHWAMALLLTWQFSSAAARVFIEDTALEQFLWATHKPLGVVLLLLALVRVGWWLYNRASRPAALSLMARLGHLGLYALMVAIPLLALLRQYGSGRAFSPFGLPLVPGFEGEEIEWLMLPANLFHGWFGWLLLAMIAGHIFMAFFHRRRAQDDDVIARIWGKR